MKTLEIIFWVFLFIVFYTYIGYGILIFIFVKIKEFFTHNKKDVHNEDADCQEVSLLIAAYNEEDVVTSKMENCRALKYPAGKLKTIWITDGSNDKTNEILTQYEDVLIFFETERSGKSAAINRVVPLINTPLIIFTDANTMLNDEAVSIIVKAFNDPLTGCVAGEKRIESRSKDNASSGGEGIYWRYESALKSLDSRLYSATGAAGELFAIKKDLFEPIEKEILLDDFVMSMRIAAKGYKIKYCKEAYAIESGSLNIAEERKRKVRIAAGGIQSIIKLAPVLNARKYPLFFFQYISHRVLRWTLTPILMFLLLPLNIIIYLVNPSILYSTLLLLQILFYLLGLMGKLVENKNVNIKIIFVPYYFLFMNINVIQGIRYLIKKRGEGTWEKAKRKGLQ